MKASTVFALAFSLLIALGAVATAKYFGAFEKKAAPIALLEKPQMIRALVSQINLYEDVTVTYDQVVVKDYTPEEMEKRFGSNFRERLMPAIPSAAHQRVLKKTVAADEPLLKEYFTDPGLPHSLADRLEPNTRAVNVSVPKDKSAGGAIRLGEYVDILLTSKVADGNKEETRTACIARNCKVIMKRNNPWTMMANDPDDKPVHFTLQANSYRAALIDYAQSRGQISLLPVPGLVRMSSTYSDPTSKEYASEDQRIEEILRGERTIGDTDLARIFRLNPASVKTPLVIQHLSGVNDAGKTVFPAPGRPSGSSGSSSDAAVPSSPVQPIGGNSVGSTGSSNGGSGGATGGDDSGNYTFRLPSATGDAPGCKNCGKKADGDKVSSDAIKP